MTVIRILNEKGSNIETAGSDTPVHQIAAMLAEKKIGAIVILDGEKLAGIFSERDIVRAIASDGIDALQKNAATYMTANVITCSRHETINNVMQKMTTGRFRHIPIVEDDKLVGIISIGDVVKRRIAEVEQEARDMRDYIAMA